MMSDAAPQINSSSGCIWLLMASLCDIDAAKCTHLVRGFPWPEGAAAVDAPRAREWIGTAGYALHALSGTAVQRSPRHQS